MARLCVPILALFLVLAAPATSRAWETANRWGIGYDADLNGLNVRYFFGPAGIDFTLGFGLETKTAAGEKAKFDLMFAPRFVYAFRLHQNLNLNAHLGAYLQVIGSHAKDQHDLNVGFFGGLAPEIVLLDHLAIEVFFGLSGNVNNLLKNQADRISFSIGTLGRRISIIGGAVFRYYF